MPDYSDDEIDKTSDDISELDDLFIDGKLSKNKTNPLQLYNDVSFWSSLGILQNLQDPNWIIGGTFQVAIN